MNSNIIELNQKEISSISGGKESNPGIDKETKPCESGFMCYKEKFSDAVDWSIDWSKANVNYVLCTVGGFVAGLFTYAVVKRTKK
ncbi:hypothetical protein GAMM_250041 [Gammaproteobacteria bacterium]